jgi:hypothetical protein
MRQIYSTASKVIVWLGQERDNSNIAMEYLTTEGLAPLKRKGWGYKKLWTREQGKALSILSERSYWRRIWIIQEIFNANSIVVYCGEKSFEWEAFDNLYFKLKTLDLRGFLLHHNFASRVYGGSAMTMVWQRAHFRHPDTPAPTLRHLLETFEDWKCSDTRDHIYGLLGLAGHIGSVTADYSLTTKEIYQRIEESEFRETTYEQGLSENFEEILVGLRFCDLVKRILKLF